MTTLKCEIYQNYDQFVSFDLCFNPFKMVLKVGVWEYFVLFHVCWNINICVLVMEQEITYIVDLICFAGDKAYLGHLFKK